MIATPNPRSETMANRLEYRSNNAYDTILLVDLETGFVRSRWDATPEATGNFLDASQDAGDWDDQRMIDEAIPAERFGDLLGWRESGQGVQMSEDMARAAERLTPGSN
jgi:hypothetical protein